MYKTLKNRPFPKLEIKKGSRTEKPMILINFFKVYNYNTRVVKLIENKTVQKKKTFFPLATPGTVTKHVDNLAKHRKGKVHI